MVVRLANFAEGNERQHGKDRKSVIIALLEVPAQRKLYCRGESYSRSNSVHWS
jgi:hypothetical protein